MTDFQDMTYIELGVRFLKVTEAIRLANAGVIWLSPAMLEELKMVAADIESEVAIQNRRASE